MGISALQVKELREKTGAGMMDCKAALDSSSGDMEGAIKYLREKGLATAAKRAGRVAAEGTVAARRVSAGEGVLLELNCETDFVAKTDQFSELADQLASVLEGCDKLDGEADAASIGLDGMQIPGGGNVADTINDRIASMGENVLARRVGRLAPGDGQGVVGSYIHAGGKIGVLVEAKTTASGDGVAEIETILRDVAMQVAAASPRFARREDVPESELEKEKDIYRGQAAQSGKPEHVVEKIVSGKIEKFYAESCLVEQDFIKDGNVTVGKLVEEAGKKAGAPIEITRFVRLQLGEASGEA
ncbi:MAG: translation elongation factor Ts [Candidatus Binatia bacterium]|nr:translation elongation factor Ts [Candidatus Binatia bacterium]